MPVVIPIDLLEIISHLQLLMPELIWDKTASSPPRGVVRFITFKKRLNFCELTQASNFINGSGLSKSKLYSGFRYRFIVNRIPLLIVIDTYKDIRNVKTLSLNNNINIKFVE